jgi:mannose-6-phosphate isomerase-like protein (cupin superfamily)
MERTPPLRTLAAALALPLPRGRRSAEVFRDGDLEVRLYAPKGDDPQTPHDRDELYIVASGVGQFRVDNRLTPCKTGDLLFAAAHATHRFEELSNDFAVWVIFYGAQKSPPPHE